MCRVLAQILDVPDQVALVVVAPGRAPVQAHDPVGRHDRFPAPHPDGQALDELEAPALDGLVPSRCKQGAQDRQPNIVQSNVLDTKK